MQSLVQYVVHTIFLPTYVAFTGRYHLSCTTCTVLYSYCMYHLYCINTAPTMPLVNLYYTLVWVVLYNWYCMYNLCFCMTCTSCTVQLVTMTLVLYLYCTYHLYYRDTYLTTCIVPYSLYCTLVEVVPYDWYCPYNLQFYMTCTSWTVPLVL